MKNILLTIFMICWFANISLAQKDQIITIKGDTVICSILSVNKQELTYKVNLSTESIKMRNVLSFNAFLVNKENLEILNDTIAASFPGGHAGLYKYITNNMIYPKTAQEKGVGGVVYINFTVMRDGTVSNIKLLNHIWNGEELEHEAIRIIAQMPAWTPAICNGDCVDVEYNLPVRFTLDSKKKKRKRK